MLTSEQFLKHLRDALNHFHDPGHLRRSPLAALFGVAGRFDMSSSLQRILTEAIESLKPKAGAPPQSHTRRVYDLLLYRYVQQFSQQEVADQLGISLRQLGREQRVALDALACQLWEQFHLAAKLGEEAGVETRPVQAVVTSPSVNGELAWLKDVPLEKPTDLNQMLPAVLDLVRPLTAQQGVCLEIRTADTLPGLAVHPVALRQALLNLLGVAIPWASGGQVYIWARPLHWEVEIEIRAKESHSSIQSLSDDNAASLDMARRLATLCGGGLALSTDEDVFSAILTLPALEQLPVLVIDDNADTLQLMNRYASDTRYRVIGTQDPEQALSLVEKFSPQIIVLDVMMPQVDGWEVLGRLRQHPHTSHIPIIVCTILPQEALALSLGAHAFVHKPISRQDFLTALDHQVALMETEDR